MSVECIEFFDGFTNSSRIRLDYVIKQLLIQLKHKSPIDSHVEHCMTIFSIFVFHIFLIGK